MASSGRLHDVHGLRQMREKRAEKWSDDDDDWRAGFTPFTLHWLQSQNERVRPIASHLRRAFAWSDSNYELSPGHAHDATVRAVRILKTSVHCQFHFLIVAVDPHYGGVDTLTLQWRTYSSKCCLSTSQIWRMTSLEPISDVYITRNVAWFAIILSMFCCMYLQVIYGSSMLCILPQQRQSTQRRICVVYKTSGYFGPSWDNFS